MNIELATDIFFISLIIGAIWIWPKSRSKASFLLFAEFCIFVGFNLFLGNNFTETPIWYDSIMALMNTAFVFGFMLVKSRYLALISALIALYHLTIFVFFKGGYVPYNYPIMFVFSLLQVLGMTGVYYGIRSLVYRIIPHDSRDSNDHRFTV